MTVRKQTAVKKPAAKTAKKAAPARKAAPKAASKASTARDAKKPAAKKVAAKRLTKASPIKVASSKPAEKKIAAPKPAAKPEKAAAAAAKGKPEASQPFNPEKRLELIAAAAARRRKAVTSERPATPTISIIKPREASPIERHRFSVGEEVKVISTSGMWFKHGIEFTVTAALPPQGGKLQYRIKNEQEPFERVVMESQLAALG